MNPSHFHAPAVEHLSALLPTYDFEFLLAMSGNGAIYKGRQISLDRDVVIKLLPGGRANDPTLRTSFDNQARTLAKMTHKNLIRIFDSGTVEGMPFVVMEYVHGQPLSQAALGTKVDPTQAVEIITGICEGLIHAHDQGIAHRSLDSSRILLNKRREPKIGGFGMDHAAGPGETISCPFRADLTAVGVMLKELLTGVSPEDAAFDMTEIQHPLLAEIQQWACGAADCDARALKASMDRFERRKPKTPERLSSAPRPVAPVARRVPVARRPTAVLVKHAPARLWKQCAAFAILITVGTLAWNARRAKEDSAIRHAADVGALSVVPVMETTGKNPHAALPVTASVREF